MVDGNHTRSREEARVRLLVRLAPTLVLAGLFVGPAPFISAVDGADEMNGSVRGKISFAGQPLPEGKISLHPVAGKPKAGKIREGTFDINGVPVGKQIVAIEQEALPKRYSSPATSGLSLAVKDGVNEMTFAIPAEGIEVGRPSPPIVGHGPDFNVIDPEHLDGKYVLLTFWSMKTIETPVGAAHYNQLRRIRREFANHKDFLIISLWVGPEDGDAYDAWSKFVLGQGTVDYGDGRRRFIDDSRWWQCTDITPGDVISTSPRYGVSRLPASFLLGPDGRLLAVRIPPEELRGEVAKALAHDP